MTRREFSLALACGLVATKTREASAQQNDHVSWVGDVLQEMESIRPGMPRAQLIGVFETDGGISSPRRRRYVSRQCPYFKVEVEFDSGDRILNISAPFLQRPILD
jgi:hypothetical protein